MQWLPDFFLVLIGVSAAGLAMRYLTSITVRPITDGAIAHVWIDDIRTSLKVGAGPAVIVTLLMHL